MKSKFKVIIKDYKYMPKDGVNKIKDIKPALA